MDSTIRAGAEVRLVGQKDYRVTSLIRNRHPRKDHQMALGIGLLQGPRVGGFS